MRMVLMQETWKLFVCVVYQILFDKLFHVICITDKYFNSSYLIISSFFQVCAFDHIVIVNGNRLLSLLNALLLLYNFVYI